MQEGDRVHIEEWLCSDLVGARVLYRSEDCTRTIFERDTGSWHWELTTAPRDAGCGATSHELLAEGDTCRLELAVAALGAAHEVR